MFDKKIRNNTITYAIDLGTSDSLIACTQKEGVHIIRNHQTGQNHTPSVVAMEDDNIIIGRQAQKKLLTDPENATSEFKLNMGFPIKYQFKSTGKKMLPEELSSEIIKDLIKSAYKEEKEKVEHAVITVPANSNPLKTRATLKAAELAGLRTAHLLLEPVAAAIAYGLEQRQKTQKAWLIYDLGGGTFDASIIKANGEEIEKLATMGVDNLGGKIFDWKIVELFQEKITEELQIKNFEKDNQKYTKSFIQLKNMAEKAKKELNTKEETTVTIKKLIDNYTFNYTLNRSQLRKIMEPFIQNTINICDSLLLEAHLQENDIEKIILVGGSTLSTTVREYITEHYQIPLEYSINPLTVVVQGAAIYANTINIPPTKAKADKFSLILDYPKISPKDNFTLKGRIYSLDEKYNYLGKQLTIENNNETIHVPVEIDGTFRTTIKAQNKINQYDIRVLDENSHEIPMDDNTPNNIKYIKSLKPGKNQLPQTIRIGLNDNTTKIIAEKKTQLKYNNRITVYTDKTIKEENDEITIAFYTGENRKIENNIPLGNIRITGQNITEKLPKNSKIDIHLEIDNIDNIKVTVHIPYTHQTLQNTFTYTPKILSYMQLQEKYEKTIEEFRIYKQYTHIRSIQKIIERHEKEKTMQYLEILMKLSQKDNTVINTTNEYLNKINNDLEKIEEIIKTKKLKEEIEKKIILMDNIVDDKKADDMFNDIVCDYECIDEDFPENYQSIYHRLIELYTKLYKEHVIRECFYYLRSDGIYTQNNECYEKLVSEGLEKIKQDEYDELYLITRKLYKMDESKHSIKSISNVYI